MLSMMNKMETSGYFYDTMHCHTSQQFWITLEKDLVQNSYVLAKSKVMQMFWHECQMSLLEGNTQIFMV